MQTEFDATKRAATLESRGLDMARAGEVFAGATLTVEDDRRDYGEGPIYHCRISRCVYGRCCLDSPQSRSPDHQHEEGE